MKAYNLIDWFNDTYMFPVLGPVCKCSLNNWYGWGDWS